MEDQNNFVVDYIILATDRLNRFQNEIRLVFEILSLKKYENA